MEIMKPLVISLSLEKGEPAREVAGVNRSALPSVRTRLIVRILVTWTWRILVVPS